jgi:hypothetical protein
VSEELFIGVGCLEAQWLPFAVLRYSIIKHARRPVTVEPLYRASVPVPLPRDPRNQQKTPFSFQRFLIPEVRSYRGRAMYLDSDMLVFDDITALFDRDFAEANVLAVPHETSVMVLDCEKLTWNIRELVADLDAGKLSYDGLMSCRSVARVRYDLPRNWNWLDNAGDPPCNVALLHYTVTSNQPWLNAGHPVGHHWINALFEALDTGSIQLANLEQAITRGFVRPSLWYQVEHRVTGKDEIPKEVLSEDKPFVEFCRSCHYAIVDGFHR